MRMTRLAVRKEVDSYGINISMAFQTIIKQNIQMVYSKQEKCASRIERLRGSSEDIVTINC